MDKAFALLVVPAKAGDGFFFEAKWRHDGVQVKRRVGAAWVTRRPAPLPDTEGWQRHYAARSGRREDGALTAKEAERRVRAMIEEHAAEYAARANHGRIVRGCRRGVLGRARPDERLEGDDPSRLPRGSRGRG